ncbi:MAG: GNAT family N-acetyltransferase [Ferruginibacter sp.]|nr:GNAT family N-acetyltransferase [Ferruginibacter sp.]
MGINIPEKWTVFGEPAFQYAYTKIQAGENMKWWCYFPVLKAENMLAGSCGYKGEPLNGVVEIGYEVAEKYRGLGLATEMAMLLVMNALKDPAVQCVQAHTLATENESVSVLRKCGFIMREEVNDPDDGNLWRWELAKKKDN